MLNISSDGKTEIMALFLFRLFSEKYSIVNVWQGPKYESPSTNGCWNKLQIIGNLFIYRGLKYN